MAKNRSTNLRSNRQIRLTPIRLIDQNNQQVGIVETAEALRMAQEAGLDLVEVAPNERPPVCRIMDYGKFKYAQKKNLKKHHEQQLKEVRLRPKTDANDRAIKLNRALKFLAKNDKVQFTMQFRGRERAHRNVGIEILLSVARQLEPLIRVERPPSMDGRHMVMIVAPVKSEFDKLAKAGIKPTIDWLNKQRADAEASEGATPTRSATASSPSAPTSQPATAGPQQAAQPPARPAAAADEQNTTADA